LGKYYNQAKRRKAKKNGEGKIKRRSWESHQDEKKALTLLRVQRLVAKENEGGKGVKRSLANQAELQGLLKKGRYHLTSREDQEMEETSHDAPRET